ncbi:MAG: hypothetical protein WCO33_03615 [bacterium]
MSLLGVIFKQDKDYLKILRLFSILIFFLTTSFFFLQSKAYAGQCDCPGGCGAPVCSSPGQCSCPFGDWSCCVSNNTPPPKKYYCTNNTCSPINGGTTGNYVDNPTCSGNCGIKCTLTRVDNTQIASGSYDSNTGQCLNLKRSNSNLASNPAKFQLNCSVEEFDKSVKRNWSITKINFDAQDIFANGATINNQSNTAELLSKKDSSFVMPSGQDSKSVDMNFKVDFTIEKGGLSNGVTCDTKLTEFVFTDPNGVQHTFYSYSCSTPNNPVNTSSYQQNILRGEIVSRLNGPLVAGVPVAPKWGTFSRNGNGNIISNTPRTIISTDTIASAPGDGSSSSDVYTDTLYFSVDNINSYNLPANVSCSDILPVSSNSSSTNYHIVCSTEDSNISEDDLAEYARQEVNGSGYKPNNSTGITLNTGTTYDYTDPVFSNSSSPIVSPRLQTIKATAVTTDWFAYKYSQTMEIRFKDGITFKAPDGKRRITVTVTDGISTVPVTIDQIIDTSLPTIDRQVEVQAMNKFNVKSIAEDDHALKTHAYYIAPTKFLSSGTNILPSEYPFLSQHRGDNVSSYLGQNQLKSVIPVSPANDFTPIINSSFQNETSNASYFVNKSVGGTRDTREFQYELDLTKLSNQTEPYDLSFGNGKDVINQSTGQISNNGFGRWYAEDSFCNASAESSATISVGSPWLQSKSGSTFIKGPSNNSSNLLAANESIHNVSSSCIPISTSINQKSSPSFCPESNDEYLSTYMYQSTANASETGPKSEEGNNTRQSKNNIASSSYAHGMTNPEEYFSGSAGAYDYIKNVIQKVRDDGSSANPINITCDNAVKSRYMEIQNSNTYHITPNGAGPSYDLNAGFTNVCDDGKGVNVISFTGGNLKIDALPQPENISPSLIYNAPNNSSFDAKNLSGNNPAWPHWYLKNDTIILVPGDVTINPDIRKDLDNGAKSLIIVAGGNIEILGGTYKSYKKTDKTDFPFYDSIDAFLIADGQIKIDEDTPSNAVVLDGIKILGGITQIGKTGSTFTPCKLPNQDTLRYSIEENKDIISNPCFNRDLVLMHNFITPAEKIDYDPEVEEVFSSAIGELNTIYSLREVRTVTDKTGN